MCNGVCSRVCHWGPVVAIGIIKWVSLATVYSNTMWWPPESGWGGLINMFTFLLFSGLTTFHFFSAMCDGPGYLPKGWQPENKSDCQYLQFCDACQGFKAPRAHHCRKCGHCVMKMDHHCPWINNCVGHFNHGHFIGFLFFAVVGCAQATYILSVTLWYGLHRSWYHFYGTGLEPKITLTVWSLLMIMFALGLAIGVVLAVGALLYFQLRAVWRNQTGIEDWIIEKADYRRKEDGERFLNPYFVGYVRNLQQVLTLSCLPSGDGIDWEVREGCDAYTLTVEQLEQKAEKRMRTREYHIVKPYSGAVCPVFSFGFKVGCRPPCTDEPRIPLEAGDLVKVTRWKKHWLYGDKVAKTADVQKGTEEENNPRGESDAKAPSVRLRGWFPRKCAVESAESAIEHRKASGKHRPNSSSGSKNGSGGSGCDSKKTR